MARPGPEDLKGQRPILRPTAQEYSPRKLMPTTLLPNWLHDLDKTLSLPGPWVPHQKGDCCVSQWAAIDLQDGQFSLVCIPSPGH